MHTTELMMIFSENYLPPESEASALLVNVDAAVLFQFGILSVRTNVEYAKN
jgi:hypothetical protein